MRNTSKLSLLVVLLASIGYSFATFAQTEDPLASIRKAGQVKVALASVPPYIVLSPSGEATGSSVDLQNMVLKELGLPALTPVVTGWDAMIPGLQARQFDYLGAGLNITEARCKAVLFSMPYYAAQIALFVQPGNPKHLKSVAEVARRPDIKLAAIATSAQQTYALRQGVKSEQVMIVPDIQAGAATVIGGRADAFIVGQFSIANPKQKGLEVVVDKDSPVDGSGAAFRKEDKAFRDAFNKQLTLLIKNGAIQKLYEKYGIENGDVEAQLLGKFTKASDLVPSCE
ncbi:ectoine/hydroxyectoine ABC transporter substrate-binding protein EhuB [Bradyrhizobium cenepequi]|uniref:ectoine/hydroxyectoine ABC transporter substrate-binding protein EhuB n=1 Tax=Bradyrhizobium cenepequi TaxID=2821403 RepID=UPI001CE39598|nr:ectoine/hydroxyectoine ABC transporter substrate-binding protein EhuB [Bradyrhizobium cenepequi]MCA6112205.1 ectoine/hydroxyectoine ABC transporter substrate-binding protein EhuB [Bradyrhizobium cenepequi]